MHGVLCVLNDPELESHNPDKIIIVMLLTASMYSKTILPTQNTGVPNLTMLPTGSQF